MRARFSLDEEEAVRLGSELQRIEAEFGWSFMHTLQAYQPDGDKTTAFEICEQLNWQAPAAVFVPTGTGTNLFGMWQGRERSTSRHRHWWLYNERSLADRLARSGFTDIRRCEFRQGRCPDVERIDSRPESLLMEATRP